MSRTEFIKAAPEGKLEELAKRQRHLIFKTGPPASGKTDALNFALKEIGISQSPYFEINIDLFVEKQKGYRAYKEEARKFLLEQVSRTFKPSRCLVGSEKCSTFIPQDLTYAFCRSDFRQYYKFRPEADKEAQALLFNEFLYSPYYRNIVYESTGSKTSYDFILKLARMAKLLGFKVHIIYPFVRWDELIRRSELRALKLGRMVCPDRIRQLRREARINLREVIRKIDLLDFPIDSVMVINNDGPKGQMKKICHFHKIPSRHKP